VELAFVCELRWYPREPPAPDYGIDFYVEAAVDGVPNGRMQGVQIKGGASFFSETAGDGVVFRSEERHLEYWLGHSLPLSWRCTTQATTPSCGRRSRPKRRSPQARLGSWSCREPSPGRAERARAAGAGRGRPLHLGAQRPCADLGWMRLATRRRPGMSRGGGVGDQELRADR
jgi:uncharacterized protein DUF4365